MISLPHSKGERERHDPLSIRVDDGFAPLRKNLIWIEAIKDTWWESIEFNEFLKTDTVIIVISISPAEYVWNTIRWNSQSNLKETFNSHWIGSETPPHGVRSVWQSVRQYVEANPSNRMKRRLVVHLDPSQLGAYLNHTNIAQLNDQAFIILDDASGNLMDEAQRWSRSMRQLMTGQLLENTIVCIRSRRYLPTILKPITQCPQILYTYLPVHVVWCPTGYLKTRRLLSRLSQMQASQTVVIFNPQQGDDMMRVVRALHQHQLPDIFELDPGDDLEVEYEDLLKSAKVVLMTLEQAKLWNRLKNEPGLCGSRPKPIQWVFWSLPKDLDDLQLFRMICNQESENRFNQYSDITVFYALEDTQVILNQIKTGNNMPGFTQKDCIQRLKQAKAFCINHLNSSCSGIEATSSKIYLGLKDDLSICGCSVNSMHPPSSSAWMKWAAKFLF